VLIYLAITQHDRRARKTQQAGAELTRAHASPAISIQPRFGHMRVIRALIALLVTLVIGVTSASLAKR
jgi:hypothetical protein